ncbi:MAG: hypothetical protein FJ308_18465 [Planctomycetes bacterium]|nr:hypothetical protein [Planctomycetota bacterium]
MGYVGSWIIYCLFGLPLSMLVAVTAKLCIASGRLRILALAAVVSTATLLFLQTDRMFGGTGYYFMSDRHRPPVLIGRSLEFLNPNPNTMHNNVATYFPLLAIVSFFLPIGVSWLLHRHSGKGSIFT